MRRRTFLVGLGASAGCVAPTVDDADGGATPTDDVPLGRHGTPPTICEEETRSGVIDAVVEPAFAPGWDGVDVPERYLRRGELDDGATVVGVAADGVARAYPLAVLWWHEVVNDVVGEPILVSYCPLCQSGLVASRVVRGEATAFDATGLLWRAPGIRAAAAARAGRVFGARWGANGSESEVRNAGNLVMADDATGSYWSQILGTAICGPMEGTELTVRPSTLTTWGRWRAEHPDAEVLLPPPHSGTV